MAKLKVSGNIVDELSEKIPTYLVALNELIKNSFDAQANNVKIKFDSKKKKLTIIDDGNGMDMSNIETLLHISKSNKKYAQLVNGRYIQGSKGLGFLSVFKFGNSVTWKTNTKSSNKGYEFTVNYNDIIKSENIENIDIPILRKENIPKGTSISISMTNESVAIFKQELKKPQTVKRLIYSFNVDNFNIEIEIDGKRYNNSKPLNFNAMLPERQLFNVTYRSNTSKIVFYHNNVKAVEYNFPFKYNDFDLDLNLIIFSLVPYSKSKIDNIFYDNRDELTPLIYINTNLFNNYTLFDTNVMQKIKYSSIMNQIIGNINIYSNNQNLEFNSDRTQFVQNELTTNISNFIEEINIFIQKRASENKKYLINFDILNKKTLSVSSDYIEHIKQKPFKNYIKKDFSFRDKVNIKYKNNTVVFSLFNKEAHLKINIQRNNSDTEKDTSPKKGPKENVKRDNNKNQNNTAHIDLKDDYLKLKINDGQINLKNFIESAKDSNCNKIDFDKIEIKCKNTKCVNGILPSPDKPYKEYIIYSYNDPITGNVSKSLTIDFINDFNSDFKFKDTPDVIIPNPIKNGYTLDENASFNNLIKQINKLDPKKYSAVIACSIRSIFELGSNDLYSTDKYNEIKFDSDLKLTISRIICFACNNNKLLTYIDSNTKIGFKNLKNNILIPGEYENAILLSHRGAHKSDKFLTLAELEMLGIKVAYFVILINEMIKYR